MAPRLLPSTSVDGQRLVPHWLAERDHPWLSMLLAEVARFEGRPRRELAARFAEPLGVPCPRGKLALAQLVLERDISDAPASPVPARDARAQLFRHGARPVARAEARAAAATALGVSPDELERSLFADLAGERRVAPLDPSIDVSTLAQLANQLLVTRALGCADHVRVRLHGGARAVVRHARLTGLLCTVERDVQEPAEANAVLHVSGPLALFRHTRLYGGALASLLPRLAWCRQFELSVVCRTRAHAEPRTLVVKSGDPIVPARELPAFDSAVERRFARDFSRLATDWHLIREPAPFASGDSLIFPDFELVHRHHSARRAYLEIVGFWTPEYLRQKLSKLRACAIARLILCVDESRACDDEQLPVSASILRYQRRVDAKAVLEMLERLTRECP